MGGGSKPTIGYWYKQLLHFGLCRGPIDAIRQIRGGDKIAWEGVGTSGEIHIDAPDLWGGEKAEGGIDTMADIMLGEPDQMPNAYLTAQLGEQQTAHRGRASIVLKGGRYGAFNPYPKAASFLCERVFEGWDDDTCWYPEKAMIPIGGEAVQAITFTEIFSDDLEPYEFLTGATEEDFIIVSNGTESVVEMGGGTFDSRIRRDIVGGEFRRLVAGFSFTELGSDDFFILELYHLDGGMMSVFPLRQAANAPGGIQRPCITLSSLFGEGPNGEFAIGDPGQVDLEDEWYRYEIEHDPTTLDLHVAIYQGSSLLAERVIAAVPLFSVSQLQFRQQGSDGRGRFANITIETAGTLPALQSMNPAHIIYDSLTASDMQGEPLDLIDEASFIAAADRLYTETFGLCVEYDASSETPEDLRQRVCNVIAATCSQSRVDGRYYLHLIRGDFDPETLPILTDDDVLEFHEEPSDPLEAVNQVTVEWFDPLRKEKRSTTPLQSLGAIESVGGTIAEVAKYPEIPSEDLALRVGARDLGMKAVPVKRFRLTTNRKPYNWRVGQFFRLQLPRRGIADMVCLLGDIAAGTLRSGTIRLSAAQDTTHLPDSTYVVPEPGIDTMPSETPTAPPAQMAMEASYHELATRLSTADLGALAADAGFLLVTAARPTSGLNYALHTAGDGEALADRGTGDWTPTAVVTEAVDRAATPADITFTEGSDLDLVTIGTAAMWGSEMVRVDALDIVAGTATLARGVGDTPPQPHDAGERLWFYDQWATSDEREYSDGETVAAKVLPRTSSQQMNATLADTLEVEMDSRAARPYAPGKLLITDALAIDAAYPVSAAGELLVEWAHRDRVLQADMLVDAQAVDVGPEAGTTYTVRYYLDDVLEETEAGIAGTAATPYTLSGDGLARVEVEAVRDGLASWLPATAEFTYVASPPDTRITDAGDSRITDAGDPRTTG
jgi:hypothetical protein